MVMFFADPPDVDDFAALMRATFSPVRESFSDLPLWAPIHWPGSSEIGPWTGDGGPHALLFRSDEGAQLTVQSSIAAAGPNQPPDFVLKKPARQLTLTVGGVLQKFDSWHLEQVEYARIALDDILLEIEARSVSLAGMEFARAHDIEPFVAGSIGRAVAARREWRNA